MFVTSVVILALASSSAITVSNVSSCEANSLKQEATGCCRLPLLIPESSWTGCLWSPIGKFAHVDPDKHCAADCLFRKLKFINDENKVNYESVRSWLIGNTEQYGQTLQRALEKEISACIDIIANTAVSNEEYVCESKADFFMKCLALKVPLNCPADMWKNNEKCDNLKEVIERCPQPNVVPGVFV